MKNVTVTFNIGDFNCFAIRDGDDWELNILLINTGERSVLIDTGIGREFPTTGLLLDRLQATGTPPAMIDIVVLSHADFDHIGGVVDEKGNLAFPNARYVLSKTEWAFWSQKPERLPPNDAYDEAFRQLGNTLPQTRLTQLGDKLELVETGVEIVPGIRMIAAPGHTPGYSIIAVSSGNEQLLFVGDLIYDPKDIENPDWYSVFDFDPAQVVVTRNRIFGQASREGTLLMAYHLPFPGLGYVSQHGKGWRWQSFEVAS